MTKFADWHGKLAEDESDKSLATAVRQWRGKTPAREAARLLGIPHRTLEGIEQGRDFRYPEMLRNAMRAVRLRA